MVLDSAVGADPVSARTPMSVSTTGAYGMRPYDVAIGLYFASGNRHHASDGYTKLLFQFYQNIVIVSVDSMVNGVFNNSNIHFR